MNWRFPTATSLPATDPLTPSPSKASNGKGSLTVYFTNEEQLQTLYDRLVGAGYPGSSGANGAGANGGNGGNGAQSYDFGSLDSIGGLLDDNLPLDGEPDGDN